MSCLRARGTRGRELRVKITSCYEPLKFLAKKHLNTQTLKFGPTGSKTAVQITFLKSSQPAGGLELGWTRKALPSVGCLIRIAVRRPDFEPGGRGFEPSSLPLSFDAGGVPRYLSTSKYYYFRDFGMPVQFNICNCNSLLYMHIYHGMRRCRRPPTAK